MSKLDYPQEAVNALLDADAKPGGEAFGALAARFMNDADMSGNTALALVNDAAGRAGVHNYTAQMVFFMHAAELLQKRYAEEGLSEDIFWNTVSDLKYKLMESIDVYGVWGTAVGDWHINFFRMKRFGLGRLQYENAEFRGESYTKCGYTVRKGGNVINMHIPSSGPLTTESRMDSYRRAYEFYRHEFDGPVIFTCSSWLLYPRHTEFLPPESNILGFMSDFDIISSSEKDVFTDAWRVFGKYHSNPPDKLPQNTSLRKAYARRMADGGKFGSGYGIFLFDGEKILR